MTIMYSNWRYKAFKYLCFFDINNIQYIFPRVTIILFIVWYFSYPITYLYTRVCWYHVIKEFVNTYDHLWVYNKRIYFTKTPICYN